MGALQKHRRLTRPSDFKFVKKTGRSWVNDNLVLVASKRSDSKRHTRFGFVASKRVGNAVVRNLVKRRMREIARSTEVELGWDLVFIVRNQGTQVGFGRLKESMTFLLKRARIFKSC